MIEKPSGVPPFQGPYKPKPISPTKKTPQPISPPAKDQPFAGTNMTEKQVKQYYKSLENQMNSMFKWIMKKNKEAAQKMKKEIERQ